MSYLTVDFHHQRGNRFFDQGEWDDATRAFSAAMQASEGAPKIDILVAWARSMLRSSLSWDAKVSALIKFSDVGYSHPKYWALALQTYLQLLDLHDGRDVDLRDTEALLIRRLPAVVAECVESGTDTFKARLLERSQESYAWGAALVSQGDWVYAFQGLEAGKRGRYPYRPLAEMLYLPVACADLDTLFSDQEVQAEIRSHLTNRARMQLHRFAAPTVRPSRAGRARLEPAGISLFALRSMS